MEKEFYNNLKVGDEVVFAHEYKYSIKPVEKVNEKSIKVAGEIFFLGDYDIKHRKNSKKYYKTYESFGIHPKTEWYLKKVKETENNAVIAKEAAENKKLQEASDKAEMEAFFASPDGEKFLAMENEWKGSALTFVDIGGYHTIRGGEVRIIDPATKKVLYRIDVNQRYAENWDTREKTYLPPDLQMGGYGQMNFKKYKKVQEALNTALAIAEEWDKETGKIVGGKN